MPANASSSTTLWRKNGSAICGMASSITGATSQIRYTLDGTTPATNSALYARQEEDMDFNCGTIVDGTESVAESGRRFFELILKTASGQKTKSEQWGYGEDEFAPWIVGATM